MNIENDTYALLDSISVGICIIDSDYMIHYWNEFMEEYTGFSKDEIHNKILFDVFPAFQNKMYEERITNIFNGWPPVIFSSRLHTPFFLSKDIYYSKRYQDITITPINSDDQNIHHALITISDVTDLTFKLENQKQLYNKSQEELKVKAEIQEKLLLSEKQLKELNSTKDKFFSLIAHDLISPFHVIFSFSNILANAVKEKDYQNLEDYCQQIYDTSKKTYTLLTNLLEWSRLQTDRISFNPVKINFLRIVNELIDLLKISASQKEIEIVIDINPELEVIADLNMLNTIIRNLLSNAIKYSHIKGLIKISAISHNNEFQFTIQDSGVGIKEEDIEKIFRIDVNFSTTGTANESGTGLGLMLCKEFIDRHKGKIWVKSELGIGSEFHFTIPKSLETEKTK